MLATPNCFERHCKHFTGVKDFGKEVEEDQRVVCKAFPEGIPSEIAYGDNLHDKPLKDQNNKIIYERED